MVTITLDSNCINAKGKHAYMNKIKEAETKGKVKIFKTDTMDTEFLKGKKYEIGLKKSAKYEEDIGILVFGHSRWGHAKFVDKNEVKKFDLIKDILFPNKKLSENDLRDCMHLYTHIIYKRDFFITGDRDILDNTDKIKKEFNTAVLSPKDFVEKILKDNY